MGVDWKKITAKHLQHLLSLRNKSNQRPPDRRTQARGKFQKANTVEAQISTLGDHDWGTDQSSGCTSDFEGEGNQGLA